MTVALELIALEYQSTVNELNFIFIYYASVMPDTALFIDIYNKHVNALFYYKSKGTVLKLYHH